MNRLSGLTDQSGGRRHHDEDGDAQQHGAGRECAQHEECLERPWCGGEQSLSPTQRQYGDRRGHERRHDGWYEPAGRERGGRGEGDHAGEQADGEVDGQRERARAGGTRGHHRLSNAAWPRAAQCRRADCLGVPAHSREGTPGRRGTAGAEDTLSRPVTDALPAITIDALLDRYDTILFDAYGVLVHGSGPMPGAAEVLHRLNREGRSYFIVTNDASKLPATAASRFQGFGLPIDAARILTSGMLLAGHFADADLVGRRCAVLGPPDSLRYVRDAGGEVVPPDEAFDVLVDRRRIGLPVLRVGGCGAVVADRARSTPGGRCIWSCPTPI